MPDLTHESVPFNVANLEPWPFEERGMAALTIETHLLLLLRFGTVDAMKNQQTVLPEIVTEG
jgi:hypothetical protein